MMLFGPVNLITTFLPPSGDNHVLAAFVTPFVLIGNMILPVPMVIIHIASFIVCKRINRLIRYLETENPQKINIVEIMMWYDDMYKLNGLLRGGVSDYIMSAILNSLPQIVFLLQVRPSFYCR